MLSASNYTATRQLTCHVSRQSSRQGGRLVNTTILFTKYTKEKEDAWCELISKGFPVTPTWGSEWVVEHWVVGKKHDPLSIQSIRIRDFVRSYGKTGVSKGDILRFIGEQREGSQLTTDLLRELDKMGIFKTVN